MSAPPTSAAPRRALALLIFTAALLHGSGAAALDDDTAHTITEVVAAATNPQLRWPHFPDYQRAAQRAYELNDFQPLWLRDGRPTTRAVESIATLFDAEARGLNSPDYDAASLRDWSNRLAAEGGGSGRDLGLFDTALTVSIMRFISDSYIGRINPKLVGFALDIEPKRLDLPPLVNELARDPTPAGRLAELQPSFGVYRRLKTALADMRPLAARTDLRAPALTSTLEPGGSDADLPAVRALLTALGDLPASAPPAADVQLYDPALVDAVKHYQHRHGLDDDGVIGPATQSELRVPLAARATQIELALERMRWLPQQFADRFLIVNIPEYRLRGFARGQRGAQVAMNVVVGEAARRRETPALSADMRYLIFRPYWNVPRGITQREMLPILRRDLGYLAKQHLQIVAPGHGVLPATQASVDLVAAGAARLRQQPGEHNSLGLVKFIFPNPSNVYLHDTPSKQLFGRSRRDFSHGCIRVADPPALAEFVLQGQGDWTRERIAEAMNGRDDRRVDLTSPVPVYLLYATAVFDDDGDLHFFRDIYGHDARLQGLLAKGDPYP